MLLSRKLQAALILLILGSLRADAYTAGGTSRRILVDTDMDTDDIFALLYLLKLNRSEFNLEAITVNSNGWSNAGHAVNQIYDILYMMDRDDIAVGVGGEGGILDDGTILPNVGGYLPIIEQGRTTVGGCRYRQTIPKGIGGRLTLDTNFGLRKEFLPQGKREYSPMGQPTAQQVLIDKVSAGPISVMLFGAHTNFAIFLMTQPHLKKNIEHIYIMGGGIGSKDFAACCYENSNSSCYRQQCRDPGNLFTAYATNPYAEFNFFQDPFAAYQVIHSGIPVTLVPLDATKTIPITKEFFNVFEQNQGTYEAQYCFKSLKMVHDINLEEIFYAHYFLWDSFMAGVAASIMHNSHILDGFNEFAKMEYMNITVVTSNEPYGITDGSNPFFTGREVPKFNLKKDGVHSGHVQTGLRDPFCTVKNGKGRCKDGYTEEVSGAEGVRVLVATKATLNQSPNSPLDRKFYISLLDALNRPQQSGRFNFVTQFPYYREILHKPDFNTKKLGKPVVFDMDMSAGDFLALFYLLKVPVEKINLKAIIVSPTGWANAATIDIVYDILHMMGRDDIPVGLGDVFAMNQSDPFYPAVGDCKYIKAIPNGKGGFLDSDTLYGLARKLPRSSRRYTGENSKKYGAHRDTPRQELRQPLALEIWDDITRSLYLGSKITILTNGPLTSLAKIILSRKNTTSLIQDVFIVGGHINHSQMDKGNVFTIPSNKYAEFNMFLDPLAAKTVFESELNITLIPLGVQRKATSFPEILKRLRKENTPEARFTFRLLSRLYHYQRLHNQYHHMSTFLGEILGAVVMSCDQSLLKLNMQIKPARVFAEGVESKDGQILMDNKRGKLVKVLENLDPRTVYDLFVDQLGNLKQSAVIGSFSEQAKMWSEQLTVSRL